MLLLDTTKQSILEKVNHVLTVLADVADSFGVSSQCQGEEPGEAGQLRLQHPAQPHPAPQKQGRGTVDVHQRLFYRKTLNQFDRFYISR